MFRSFFNIYILYICLYSYISIYIYIYIYICLYISIYILKKERNVLAFFWKRTKRSCVLFRSLQKNVALFAFFSVLCKRMLRSLRYFLFFRKEHNILLVLISRQKTREKNGKERKVPNGKELSAQPCFSAQKIWIVYTGLGIRSFQKNVPFFAFFSVLLKRTFHSLRSFLFF